MLGSFDNCQWPHDPNLTAFVLLAMLVRWCEKYQLPPVLYLIQLDNCVKENKNQYILWLLALLVELEIFKKVKFEYHWQLIFVLKYISLSLYLLHCRSGPGC